MEDTQSVVLNTRKKIKKIKEIYNLDSSNILECADKLVVKDVCMRKLFS